MKNSIIYWNIFNLNSKYSQISSVGVHNVELVE